MKNMIHLRIPDAMHDRLKEVADEQGTTMTMIVVALLAREFGFQLPAQEPVIPFPADWESQVGS